jgi:polysaccharide chain length determinant protein (PEP-CTERM system associated)
MTMTEVSEEQSPEGFDINQILDLVRRRHIQFLIPVFLGWLVVWGASWVLPPRYKSTTLILVEQPAMPKNYVTPNVSDDLQSRLASITQQILSRTRLLLIIDKMHLYSGMRKAMTPDAKVALMRKDIDIELVRDPQNDEITSFRVSYSASKPLVAQQVTNELTDLFINENLRVREEESQGTTDFLEQQLESARKSLSDQDSKVQKFQGQHEGELPSQQASNLQILAGLQSQLQNEQDALNTARQRGVYLEALLEQYRSLHGAARHSDSSAAAPGAPTDLQSIDDQLDKLRAQLADLSSRYTDHYPDVQNVKNQIAKLEIVRDKFLSDSKQQTAGGKDPNAASDAADPALGAPTLQLQGELQANHLEVSNRERSVAELKGRINDYQARLNEEPATEQQLADLTRGYEQSKTNYDDLLKKRDDSAMATSMEQMQQGERFTMLDPPSLPLQPDFPNRLKFCGIGLGFGLAVGAALVGGLEFMDGRLYSEQQIKTMLQMSVVSEIPEVVNAADIRNRKGRTVLGWVMAAIVVASILGGTVFSYLRA